MYRYAHFKYPAVNTGVGYIGWIVQHVGADIGGEYQGLTASVSAVDDVVNVFKSVFCSSLRAKIVNDEQRKTAQTLNIFVSPLKARAEVVEYCCEIGHTDRDFFETVSSFV